MGGKNQTSTTKMEPWAAAQPALRLGLGKTEELFNNFGFAPQTYAQSTGRSKLAGQSNPTTNAMEFMRSQAYGDANRGNPLLDAGAGATAGLARGDLNEMQQTARGGLEDMMSGGITEGLQGAKDRALAEAIPQATAMFSGSGMANSSQAQEGVSRAAVDAIAPYEYGAAERGQDRMLQATGMLSGMGADTADRSLQAAGLAPSMYQAGYLPSQMLGQVGAQMDTRRQSERDANVDNYYERTGRREDNLRDFIDLTTMMGGLGSSGSQTQPGPGFAQKAGSSLLGGLGTYGALAANPVTAPFAMMGGIGSGLLGLF